MLWEYEANNGQTAFSIAKKIKSLIPLKIVCQQFKNLLGEIGNEDFEGFDI